MVHVLFQCKVPSVDRWKQLFASAFNQRAAAGEISNRIFCAHERGEHIVVMFTWNSAQQAAQFFDSEFWRGLLREAGATEVPERLILNEMRALHLTAAD
ncbi:MAG TPA: hypothetical protein VMU24_13955 [Candidatus Acidoferrales bacterium]|nr:hypothetical protein [Candidatus Acidoferrales bacterium]